VYADVVDAVPITQTSESPQRVCGNQTVQVRQPERFGNRDGAVVGAVVGGLLGHQVGGGSGRTLATVGGAVAGGYVGRNIDRRHVGGRVTTQTERVCHTETRTREKTIGYEVRYNQGGQLRTMRMSKKPSDQVWLGDRSRTIGYDVDWRYRDKTGTVRLVETPGACAGRSRGKTTFFPRDAGSGQEPRIPLIHQFAAIRRSTMIAPSRIGRRSPGFSSRRTVPLLSR
jgi:uncharacterized protein YcfJ